MKTLVEYVGNVLSDGHLSVPEEVRQALGLEPHVQVQVTIKLIQPDAKQVQEAWALFRHMGQGAGPGRLPDASTQHDRYLYGKKG